TAHTHKFETAIEIQQYDAVGRIFEDLPIELAINKQRLIAASTSDALASARSARSASAVERKSAAAVLSRSAVNSRAWWMLRCVDAIASSAVRFSAAASNRRSSLISASSSAIRLSEAFAGIA